LAQRGNRSSSSMSTAPLISPSIS